jgi:hypothetical protein
MHVVSEVMEIIPSYSKPDRGILVLRSETRNQRDEVVQVLTSRLVVPGKPQVYAAPSHTSCEASMTSTVTHDPKTTALLCIDFYNDFLSEGGNLWPWVKDIAKEVNLLDNLHTIVRTLENSASRFTTCRTIAGSPATT